MGDCGDDFKALSEYHRQKKRDRQTENMQRMQASGLVYSTDTSGSLHIYTDKGKVIFYPTTNKFQHKGKVRYGNAAACEKYVRSLFT